MVLYETLRLYGAVLLIVRQATAGADLYGVKLPKGDEEVWGADTGAFNPLQFRDGMGRVATHPNTLLTFSLGPRSCIGQDFAMLEAKATLALILRRFAFQVAPEYVHALVDFLTLQPSKGLPVVLKLLEPAASIICDVFPQFRYHHISKGLPAALWFVGPTFVGLTGLVFKEGMLILLLVQGRCWQ
uniref:Cytochrome P450 709B2 n=1 Tax=Zea mays TaxID=4577 RepID=A0A804PMW1_MAIZE